MPWVPIALTVAALDAGRSAFVKRAMDGVDEFVVVLALGGSAVLLVGPVVLLRGVPPLAPDFWWALAVSGGINVVAALLVARAVHVSDLSLVVPLKSLTPLFMLATGPLMLGERASAAGGLGVALIVVGAWTLNAERGERSLLGPARALLSDPGARLMLVVSFLYSISSTADKVGVLASGPLAWVVALNGVMVAGSLPMVLLRRGRRGPGPAAPPDRSPGTAALSGSRRWLLAAGVASATLLALQMYALTLTQAAYVIAVKRTGILVSVLLGHWFFGETGLRSRLAGAALLLAGFALLTLG